MPVVRADHPSRVVIVGCGDVGATLGVELAALGHEVYGARRNPAALPDGLLPLRLDVTDPATFERLPRGIDLVFYTAAAGRGADETAYRAVYVDGVRHLVAALRARGERPRRAILTSSTSVYGQDDGGWVDEASPTVPNDFRGAAVLAGEREFVTAPWPTTRLRLGGIYGPGRTAQIDAVRERRLVASSAGPSPFTNRIHRDDAARALRHLAELPDRGTGQDLYCGVDREPVRRDVLVRWLAAELGVEPGEPPDDERGTARPSRGGDKRVSSARLVATGFEFRYPTWRDGYAALLGRAS